MKIKKYYRKKICLFFNHERGLKIAQFLNKKKKFKICKIYLSKKNLKKEILSTLRKLRLNFTIIKNVNSTSILRFNLKNKIDLNIICGFPYIFKGKLLRSPKYGTINLHGGKLPEYKGASTLNWQIINGEKKIGFSIIQANEKIDCGNILAQSSFNLKEKFDIEKVHKIVNKKFPKLLDKVLNKIFKNKLNPLKNLNGKVYKQRKPTDGRIDWKKMTNTNAHNFIRALTKPYPGAFCYEFSTKKKIIIFKSRKSKFNPKIKPGTVFTRGNLFYIKCKNESIRIIKSSDKLFDDCLMY